MNEQDILASFDRMLLHWRERGLDAGGASLDQLLRSCQARLERDEPRGGGMTMRNNHNRTVVFAARFTSDADFRFVSALASYAISLSKPTPFEVKP